MAERPLPVIGPLDVSWRPDTGSHTIHTPIDKIKPPAEKPSLTDPLPQLPKTTLDSSGPV